MAGEADGFGGRAKDAGATGVPGLTVARAVLDGLPDPVILVDARREIVAFNRAAADLFQTLQPGRDVAQSIRHPAILSAVDVALAGEVRQTGEVSFPAPVRRDFAMHVVRLGGEAEEAGAAVAIALHDVSAARRVEEMRADFVANVSHELRSPLAVLIGVIETIREAAQNDAAARERFLDMMHGEASRMARLIDDLLSLSRVEIAEHIQPRDPVDLLAVLQGIERLLGPRAAARGMRIVLEGEALPPVAGDRDQLMQVFQNLVDNAIKYARPDSVIRLIARPVARLPERGRAGVAVAVEDEGEGIPADDIPRLTERFYRVDKGRSRSLGGTGLGLAIVKHIVSRHRGRLTVESTPGKGSRFTVLLRQAG